MGITTKSPEELEDIINSVLNDSSIKIYVLGRNDFSRQLNSVLNISAFIDDYTQTNNWLNKPVIKLIDVNQDSIVICCSTAIYPISALKKLQKMNFKYITYLDLFNKSILPINAVFFEKSRNDFLINKLHYKFILQKLKDSASKKIFNDIIKFRNTGEFKYLENYFVDEKNQYFPDFIELSEEVFVDAGGFDGKTSLAFIQHCQNYKSIYLFEPSQCNLKKAKNNLSGDLNINFIDKGLSDTTAVLNFDCHSGSASSISNTGNSTIHVDSLDNLVKEKITFLKMDIEGAESLAIEGAKQHILNDHPKMAISVYHKPDDLWKIPEQILSIRNDYNLYLRHYTEGTDESVMYFIPTVQV